MKLLDAVERWRYYEQLEPNEWALRWAKEENSLMRINPLGDLYFVPDLGFVEFNVHSATSTEWAVVRIQPLDSEGRTKPTKPAKLGKPA